MLECERPRSFRRFIETLQEHGLLTKGNGRPDIVDERQLLDFGFGLFLTWLLLSVRTNQVSLRFVKLDDEHTLFLVEPNDRLGILPSPEGHLPPYCIDDLCNSWPVGEVGPLGCLFTNTLRFNASSLGVQLPEDLLTQLIECDGGNCIECRARKVSVLSRFLREYPDAGRLLGGYPVVLRVKPQLFWEVFAYVDEDNRHQSYSQLFDSFLTCFAGIKSKAYVAWSNTCLTSPFKSWELDGILWNETGDGLVVLETSAFTAPVDAPDSDKKSRHHLKQKPSSFTFTAPVNAPDSDKKPSHHLKQKLLSFTALRNMNIARLSYIMLCLFDTEPQFLDEDQVLGQVANPVDQSARWIMITWPESLRDVRAKLRRHWWDIEALRQLYAHYLDEVVRISQDTLQPTGTS